MFAVRSGRRPADITLGWASLTVDAGTMVGSPALDMLDGEMFDDENPSEDDISLALVALPAAMSSNGSVSSS